MREKLRNSAGETLVEVLASILICSMSVLLLLGAVASSGNLDLRARTMDEKYYGALSKAERQKEGEDESSLTYTVTVKSTAPVPPGAPSAPSASIPCTFYGTERLLSYKENSP